MKEIWSRQGRKGPLVNKESFFTTDQSTTLTNYIWYVYRHMCVLVYTCTIHVLPSQSQESEKRVSDANVHMYTCIQAMASPFLEFVDLMSAFVSYIHPHCSSQSKTKPFLSLPLPVHVSRSLSQSLTFSNQALVVYSWSKRFRPSTTVLTAPWSGSLGTPHDVL